MANIGPTWVLSATDGPHVGSVNLVIRVRLKLHVTGWILDAMMYPQWPLVWSKLMYKISSHHSYHSPLHKKRVGLRVSNQASTILVSSPKDRLIALLSGLQLWSDQSWSLSIQWIRITTTRTKRHRSHLLSELLLNFMSSICWKISDEILLEIECCVTSRLVNRIATASYRLTRNKSLLSWSVWIRVFSGL